MTNVLAQKTFTVKKIINGKTLTFTLKVDKALTQIYSRDTKSFAPDYTEQNLTITPMLLVSGLTGDQIANVSGFKWSVVKQDGTASATNLVDTESSSAKKLATNLTDCTGLKITCEATYTDPTSKITAPITASIDITKVENAGMNILASMYMPQGDTFDNSTASLKLHCDLMRGGDIDNTDVTYKWMMLRDGSWVELDESTAQGIANFTTNEITVPASAVTNVGIFKCVIKDADEGSATAQKEVFAIGTLYDGSDPYEIDVFQPNGDSVDTGGTLAHWFKIRQGATYVTNADFLQAHKMFVWRFAANNAMDTTWGEQGRKECTLNAEQARYELTIAYADLLSSTQAFTVELN